MQYTHQESKGGFVNLASSDNINSEIGVGSTALGDRAFFCWYNGARYGQKARQEHNLRLDLVKSQYKNFQVGKSSRTIECGWTGVNQLGESSESQTGGSMVFGGLLTLLKFILELIASRSCTKRCYFLVCKAVFHYCGHFK